MELNLGGQTAIVTGGSRGIGSAIAARFAHEGMNLLLVARDTDDLESFAGELRQLHDVDVLTAPMDMRSESAADEAVSQAVEHFGELNVLVNNAGASPFGSLKEISDSDWMASIELKLLGYIRCIRAALEAMDGRGGAIVNIVGAAGRFATEGYVLGCLNAALLHVTKSTSDLAARDNVRVIAVNPSLTLTTRVDHALDSMASEAGVSREDIDKSYLDSVPLSRFAQPEEVADVVAFACSNRCGYLTGSSIDMDGGSMRGRF